MERYKRAVCVTGTYTDRNGETKKRYQNIGTLFRGTGNDGEPYISLKLDAVPIGSEWTGWVSFYDLEPRKQAPKPVEKPEFDDEIPF